MIDSTENENVVVRQSVLPNLKVNVNTNIVLYVSKGQQPEQPTEPTEPTEPENYVEQTVEVMIPVELTKDAVLSVWYGTEMLDERDVFPGTIGVQMKLKGEGTMVFTAMLDNDPTTAWVFEVEFPTTDIPTLE